MSLPAPLYYRVLGRAGFKSLLIPLRTNLTLPPIRCISSFYSLKDKPKIKKHKDAQLILPKVTNNTKASTPSFSQVIFDDTDNDVGTFSSSQSISTLNHQQDEGDEIPLAASSNAVVNPFSSLPSLPPLPSLLKTAIARANKHRISNSLRSSSTATAPTTSLRRPSSSKRSSTSSNIARSTWKVKQSASQQITSMHDTFCTSLSNFLSAFPNLSQLHPFDRAVMRLILSGGDVEYVQRLREGRKLVNTFKLRHARALKDLEDSNIAKHPAQQIQDEDLQSLLSQPSTPPSKDLDSILIYHRRLLLHTTISAASVFSSLSSLSSSLSSTPVISTSPPPPLTVLLIGMPNVGKSSLLRMLSSGRAEVQNYAFTTQGLKVGHMIMAEDEDSETEQAEETKEIKRRRLLMEEKDPNDTSNARNKRRKKRFLHSKPEDEDARAVRLHSQRQASSSHLRSIQQQQTAHNTLLSSLYSSSSLLSVQIIDTPGLLPRPDTQRKAMELMSLTALHHLNVQCILFIIDESGSGGFSCNDQLIIRKEIMKRYQKRFIENEVSWIDVYSKSDIKEKYNIATHNTITDDDDNYEEEAKMRLKEEMNEYHQLYGTEYKANDEVEVSSKVNVSIDDNQSVLNLQRELKTQLRIQWRRLLHSRGESYETIEKEFQRAY